MKKSLLIFFAAFLFVSVLSAQDTVVAKVGGSVVTAGELKERFHLTPQVYKKQMDTALKRRELLYSIIAEKLWALEAENKKLDSLSAMQSTFKQIEKMFVRDALYKAEITDKIVISEEELTTEMENYFTSLSLYFLFASDSSTSKGFYEKLNSGASVFSILTPGEFEAPMIEVNYGDMKPDLEEKLFSLEENGFTRPIKSGGGWIIFYLAKRNQKSFTSEDVNSSLKKVEKFLRQKKEQKKLNEFMKSFFSGKKITTNGELFWSMTGQIARQLQKKKPKQQNDSVVVRFDALDYLQVASNLGSDTLKMPFVIDETYPLLVDEFLRTITFEGFGANKTDINSISYLLNVKVKTIIENEQIAREAYNRGYQNLADVKRSISMWRDNYLARMLKDQIISSTTTTEDEVRDYYFALNNGKQMPVPEVNIIEVLTDSLEVVELVLDKLNNGADFRALAMQHTKRLWVKKNNGEFGFFPINLYGEIGKAAAQMEIGEVYGPLKVDDSYSIFKLIDRKEAPTSAEVPFEEVKDKLYEEVRIKKLAQKFIDYTIELANKYGVDVNQQAVNNILLKDYQMIAYCYMGFGGRLLAVPLTIPFTEWVTPWLEQKKENP